MKLSIIRKKSMTELLAAIYENEGWQRKAGESRMKRVKLYYSIDVDLKANKFVAERAES